MIFRHKCLDIPGEMVYDNQYILHHQFLFCCYGDFHSNVVNVDQLHRFSADNRLHWWELSFSLVLDALATIGYGFNQGLGHTRQPKAFLHQTQCVITALVPHTMVANINCGLTLSHGDFKDRG